VKPIVVVGSINLDLVVRTRHIPSPGQTILGQSFQTFFGGKGANQAVGVAKLGYSAAIIGKVGLDGFGDQLLEELLRVGVDAQAIKRVSQSSGVAVITTEDSAENTIIVVPGANGALNPDDVADNLPLLRSAAMVMVQLEIPMETVLSVAQLCNEENIPLMLDPAPAAKLSSELLAAVTWVTPNETEVRQLTGTVGEIVEGNEIEELAEQLLRAGARNVVLKLGAKGSFLATRDGLRRSIPAVRITPTDSTAAGDAYNAAFAVALCEGRSAEDAANFASAAAAISVTREGAQTSLATRAEISALIDSWAR